MRGLNVRFARPLITNASNTASAFLGGIGVHGAAPQSSTLSRSVPFEDVPLEHRISTADFGGQYARALHSIGSIVPSGQ
eukprot:scaffold22164_cov68-Phaeocystis_antarctica.AAC.7